MKAKPCTINITSNPLGIRSVIVPTILLLVDVLAFFVSLLGAFLLRRYICPTLFHIPSIQFSMRILVSIWWMPIVYIFFIGLEGLYDRNISFWEGLRRLWRALSYATIVCFAFIAIGKFYFVSRLLLLLCGLISFITFPIFRHLAKQFINNVKELCGNVIIIGAGRAGQSVAKGIKEDVWYNYNIVGFLDDYKSGYVKVNGESLPIIGKLDDIYEVACACRIDTAILAIPSMNGKLLKKVYSKTRVFISNVIVVPELLGISMITSSLDYLFYEQIFLLHTKNSLMSKFNMSVKRCFDLFLSILLIPFIVPIMLVIALLIRLDSDGPVIYKQARVGRGNKIFNIYKFRSMYMDAEDRLQKILETDVAAREYYKKYFKLKNDPRITRIGRFLRATSLDELPQLFNVLRGDMSLVGPRAVVEKELRDYYKDNARFYLLVRPGISGLWQVSGRNKIDYEHRVQLDSWYVHNWCLWLDFVILLRTIKVVIKREGAY